MTEVFIDDEPFDDMGIFDDYEGPDNPDYNDWPEYDDWYEDKIAEEDDRFFERWGYYPEDETPEEAALRAEITERDQLLEDINRSSLEGASTSLGRIIIDTFQKTLKPA